MYIRVHPNVWVRVLTMVVCKNSFLAVALEKLELEHKEMMVCLDITCLCLEKPVCFENACNSPISLLDVCHLRAFFSNSYSGPRKGVTRCQACFESEHRETAWWNSWRFNLKVDFVKFSRQRKETQIPQHAKINK